MTDAMPDDLQVYLVTIREANGWVQPTKVIARSFEHAIRLVTSTYIYPITILKLELLE